MGLIGLLFAALILVFLFFFFNPFQNENSSTPVETKKIETQAEETINSALQKSKLEQNQIKDLPE